MCVIPKLKHSWRFSHSEGGKIKALLAVGVQYQEVYRCIIEKIVSQHVIL